MTHDRLNFFIRLALALTVLITVGLVVIAAKPGYRYFGTYPAVAGTPQPITVEWDTPVAYVTVSQPAAITFPDAWHIKDAVCMVVQYSRGSAPPVINYDSFQPQVQWDLPPDQAIVVTFADIQGKADDASNFSIENSRIAPQISAKLPFRITWVGSDQITLYDNQAAGGLLCYTFQVPGEGLPRIPFRFQVAFTAKNAHVMRNPSYYFEYNFEGAKLPPETVALQRQEITSYLSRLVSDAPFAVKPMTPAQISQRAAETASK